MGAFSYALSISFAIRCAFPVRLGCDVHITNSLTAGPWFIRLQGVRGCQKRPITPDVQQVHHNVDLG